MKLGNKQLTCLIQPKFSVDVLTKLMVNFALVAGVLCVCIHSAQNLLPMDKNGLSDPYCIVYENKREVNIVRPPPPQACFPLGVFFRANKQIQFALVITLEQ